MNARTHASANKHTDRYALTNEKIQTKIPTMLHVSPECRSSACGRGTGWVLLTRTKYFTTEQGVRNHTKSSKRQNYKLRGGGDRLFQVDLILVITGHVLVAMSVACEVTLEGALPVEYSASDG